MGDIRLRLRAPVLGWNSFRNNFLESLRTSDEMFGAEGRPIHALEKAGELAIVAMGSTCSGR